MKIIQKIKIENFRSFLRSKKSDRTEINEVTDLNIFYDSNESGKLNILRAINLFFTGEVSRGVVLIWS